MLTYSGLFRPPRETMGEVLLSAGASPHGLDDPPVIRTRFALYQLCQAGAVQLGSCAASRALTSLFRLTPSSAARIARAL